MRESRSRALLFRSSVRLQRLVICVNRTVRPPQWRVIENKKMRPLIWHVHRPDFQWRRLWIGSQNVSKSSYISVWRKKFQLLWIRLARSRNIRWPQVSVFARRPPVPIFMHFIRRKVSDCRATRERRVPLSWYFEWVSPPSKLAAGSIYARPLSMLTWVGCVFRSFLVGVTLTLTSTWSPRFFQADCHKTCSVRPNCQRYFQKHILCRHQK